LQQPVGQDVESQVQTPDLHSLPEPHEAHVAPPVPHALADWAEGTTHLPVESQQPFVHVEPLHGIEPSLLTSDTTSAAPSFAASPPLEEPVAASEPSSP
jgi:hypothetical protein